VRYRNAACKKLTFETADGTLLKRRLWVGDGTDSASKLTDPLPLTQSEHDALATHARLFAGPLPGPYAPARYVSVARSPGRHTRSSGHRSARYGASLIGKFKPLTLSHVRADANNPSRCLGRSNKRAASGNS
jgi:hypothetical protein